MKILQLVTKRQYRGAEVACATFSEEFVKIGHNVCFVGLYKAPETSLSVKGAKNIDLNINRKGFSFSGLLKLFKIIWNENPDILHANGSDTLKYLVMIKLFFPNKILFYRNISLVSKWIGNSRGKLFFYKLLFSRVDFVTSVGIASRDDIISTFDLHPDKVKVISRGIIINHINSIQEDLINRDHEIISILDARKNSVLIHVGNFSKEKNHDLLINSFKLILERNPTSILILLGIGYLLNDMQKKVNSLGIQHSVFFLGVQRNMAFWYKKSSILLLTSSIEGVPGVILEAASFKIPAVSTNVGGVQECVINGKTGLIVNSFDPQVFCNAVIELLEDKVKTKEFGQSAFNFVVNNYNIETQSQKFLNLFNNHLFKGNGFNQ
jgi:L-malate glycosyltransferase